jgi:hypothetical protein
MDYDRFRATAKRLVGNFGNHGIATFHRKTVAGYDPVTDAEAAVETAHSVECVVVPRGSSDISTPFDDRTETELVKIITASEGLSITPQTGDTVEIPGRPGRFSVTDCKPIRPDGSNIVFLVNAERGTWAEAAP